MNKILNKIYIKVCRNCGNRVHFYNPVLESIRTKILKRKETILESLQLIEDTNEVNYTAFEIKQLNKQLEKAQKALQKLDILFEEDEIDLVTYRQRKSIRLNEMETIKEQIEEIKSNDLTNKKKTLQEQLNLLDKLFEKWELLDGEGLSNEDLNRMLHFLVDRIYWIYEKGDNKEPIIEILYK